MSLIKVPVVTFCNFAKAPKIYRKFSKLKKALCKYICRWYSNIKIHLKLLWCMWYRL